MIDSNDLDPRMIVKAAQVACMLNTRDERIAHLASEHGLCEADAFLYIVAGEIYARYSQETLR